MTKLNKVLRFQIVIILILASFGCQAQSIETTFISKGKTFEKENKYSINEMIIYSDSTFILSYYKIRSKREKDQYQNFIPKISTGKFTKKGEYLHFKEIGGDSIFTNHFRLNGTKLVYYYKKKGELKKGAIFRKVKTSKLSPKDEIREISDYIYFRSIDSELKSQTVTIELRYGDYISGTAKQNITEFIYPETRELIQVKISGGDYPVYTDSYYYKKGSLVYIETWVATEEFDAEKIKLFIRNGKAVNEVKITKDRVQEIIDGGNRYMRDYMSRL